LIFRLAKETHVQARSGDFKSKLLNMMMMLNVGNLAKWHCYKGFFFLTDGGAKESGIFPPAKSFFSL